MRSTVFDGGKMARVEMGHVSFDSEKIPVTGPKREVINEKISVGGREFTFCAATIGNPHCVVVACDALVAGLEFARAAPGRALPEIAKRWHGIRPAAGSASEFSAARPTCNS